ncbi:MAG: hypothetical protein VW338_10485 [Rhodospirillaceae bacterium]
MIRLFVRGAAVFVTVELEDEERPRIAGRAIRQEQLDTRFGHGRRDQGFQRSRDGVFLAVLGDDLDRHHAAFVQLAKGKGCMLHLEKSFHDRRGGYHPIPVTCFDKYRSVFDARLRPLLLRIPGGSLAAGHDVRP